MCLFFRVGFGMGSGIGIGVWLEDGRGVVLMEKFLLWKGMEWNGEMGMALDGISRS